MAHFRLADAVDAAEALLDPIGIPWQVVVHHQVGSLQVDTFTRSIACYQDRDVFVLGERLLDLAKLFTPKAAMVRNYDVRLAGQAAKSSNEAIERVALV